MMTGAGKRRWGVTDPVFRLCLLYRMKKKTTRRRVIIAANEPPTIAPILTLACGLEVVGLTVEEEEGGVNAWEEEVPFCTSRKASVSGVDE